MRYQDRLARAWELVQKARAAKARPDLVAVCADRSHRRDVTVGEVWLIGSEVLWLVTTPAHRDMARVVDDLRHAADPDPVRWLADLDDRQAQAEQMLASFDTMPDDATKATFVVILDQIAAERARGPVAKIPGLNVRTLLPKGYSYHLINVPKAERVQELDVQGGTVLDFIDGTLICSEPENKTQKVPYLDGVDAFGWCDDHGRMDVSERAALDALHSGRKRLAVKPGNG